MNREREGLATMEASKQEQQKLIGSADTEAAYEWSYMRVAEGTGTNVVSAAVIGTGGIFLGLIYAAWTLLLNVLHAPAGLVGILAFILLGAVLMLIILVLMIVAWFRRLSSPTLAGMLLGAMVGAALGAAIASKQWKIDLSMFEKAQEQEHAAQQKASNP